MRHTSLPLVLLTLGCAPPKPGSSTGTAPADTGGGADTAAVATDSVPETAETADTAPLDDSPPCALGEDGLLPAVEGDFIAAGSVLSATRDRCAAAIHATAGAVGSTLQVSIADWTGSMPPTLTWLGPTGLTWSAAAPLSIGSGATLTLPQSGELLLRLDPADPNEAADDYTLSVQCIANCDLGFTRFPIVLMHGMGGSDSFLSVVDYFYEVPEALEAQGYAVEVPVVDAFASVADRADQWQAALDELQAEGVGRRFNLIAHSQGGLDARYLAGALLDSRVASVDTIGTPHHGTAVADAVEGVFSADPSIADIVDIVVEAYGLLVGLSGDDLSGQVEDMSTTSMDAFNDSVLDAPGVYYSSWAGHTCAALDFSCQDAESGEVVDPLLALTQLLVGLEQGDNDGLVSTDSAQWGDYQGEIPADHLDEIGQIADDDNPAFDHVAFYEAEAARLAGLGY